ncbi:hypothetical protein DFH09DRAFT_1146919 [Mycena vulgaris]|nr:hypothetical protein DFH09DRAFT_1146919 [Mycena vulgaris]
MAPLDPLMHSQSPQQAANSGSQVSFPILLTESFNSNSSSRLTSSDKLSELPISSPTTSPNRGARSQTARALRRSLDSLPSFSTGDSGHSPRISQAWSTIPASKSLPRTSVSDVSQGNDTPKQRVSFDSDRPQGVVGRNSAVVDSASQSRSRAASPLRIFQHLSAGFHRRNDPFVPVNPFEFNRFRLFSFQTCFGREAMAADTELAAQSSIEHLKLFVTDTLPRQIYLHLLLRLPSMYFSRVARIFEDAEVSRPDIERMISAGMGGELYTASARESLVVSARAPTLSVLNIPLPFPDEWTPAVVSPALIRFKHSWEDFIGALIKEWKTLNVVSALLLSAILTMFQIPPVASDPVTRTTALLSMVSALMSLVYGCVYLVRFATMGSMYRASKFAEEARKTDTLIWWNVWTLLSMPVVFLAWSVVFFIMSIMSFVWRTGSVVDPDERQSLGPHAVLGPRIAITIVLLLGLLYFGLIIATLRRYGDREPTGSTPARDGDAEAQLPSRGRTMERTPSGRIRLSRREAPANRTSDGADIEKGAGSEPDLRGLASAGTGDDLGKRTGTVQSSSVSQY